MGKKVQSKVGEFLKHKLYSCQQREKEIPCQKVPFSLDMEGGGVQK
jgi:hypothetical protein